MLKYFATLFIRQSSQESPFSFFFFFPPVLPGPRTKLRALSMLYATELNPQPPGITFISVHLPALLSLISSSALSKVTSHVCLLSTWNLGYLNWDMCKYKIHTMFQRLRAKKNLIFILIMCWEYFGYIGLNKIH